MPRRIGTAPGLEEEPAPALRLVDPDFDQARRRDVTVPRAEFVHDTKTGCERLIVAAELGEHVGRFDESSVVVEDPLGARDVADRD